MSSVSGFLDNGMTNLTATCSPVLMLDAVETITHEYFSERAFSNLFAEFISEANLAIVLCSNGVHVRELIIIAIFRNRNM